MICRHKLYHFTVANTCFTAPLTRRSKTKFATIKWYNLCLQIIQSQMCYPLISVCSKWSQKCNNAKRSIPVHSTFVNDSHCDLHLWPGISPKKIQLILSPWLTCLPSLMKNTQRISLYHVHKLISTYSDDWAPIIRKSRKSGQKVWEPISMGDSVIQKSR